MTFEELNIVRELKKQIRDEEQKIQALRDCAETITQKYSRETLTNSQYPKTKKSYTTLDTLPTGGNNNSRVESFSVLIIDGEKKLSALKIKADDEAEKLIRKIQTEFENAIEQTILLYRYVLCKPFRDISRQTKYSLTYIFNVHNRLIKNLQKKR